MNISVKFVLLITLYLLKYFNKKKIELELETWSLNSLSQENLKDILDIERKDIIKEDEYIKSYISIPWA